MYILPEKGKCLLILQTYVDVESFILHRWVHPEFEDEDTISREVETGTGTVEDVTVKVEDNRKVVNNCTTREEEEKLVVVVEMESSGL